MTCQKDRISAIRIILHFPGITVLTKETVKKQDIYHKTLGSETVRFIFHLQMEDHILKLPDQYELATRQQPGDDPRLPE